MKSTRRDFVRNGKGLIGVHSSTDCLYKWPEYGKIIGGYFDGHPWNEEVRVKLDDPGHPLLKGFKGLDFTIADEIYQFRNYSRDSLRVLMSLDVTKTDMTKDSIKRTDSDFAVAWIHEYGKGRVSYFSLGHRKEIFWTPAILQCYLDGIQYALGDLPADAPPSSKLKKSYLEKSRTAAFVMGMKNMLNELASYKLSENNNIAKQVDEFVDKHLNDSRANREALSRGLAQVAVNPRATMDGRALACRKLSMVGTDNAVPDLETLLADREIVEDMQTADVKAKAEYAKILGARKARGAMDELLAAARDADTALAGEARKAISLMVQAEDLPAIVALVIDTTDASGLRYLENIIVKAAKTTEDEKLKTAAVLKALKEEIPVNPKTRRIVPHGRSPHSKHPVPTKARHVKIVQTGSTEFNWWSIYDLQIIGE